MRLPDTSETLGDVISADAGIRCLRAIAEALDPSVRWDDEQGARILLDQDGFPLLRE
jgi:hypothetical protein